MSFNYEIATWNNEYEYSDEECDRIRDAARAAGFDLGEDDHHYSAFISESDGHEAELEEVVSILIAAQIDGPSDR